MKLIIRDDDVNFFTKVEDIKNAYKEIPTFPISFAVIPTVTDVTVRGHCLETLGNKEPRPIGDNKELCEWLKFQYKTRRCDLLMHGITHGYHNEHGRYLPEMVWIATKGYSEVKSEILKNKEYLEDVFDITVNCFVAPSNLINKEVIRAVYESGMNYSGVIPINFQRDFNYKSICNYLKRMYVRIFYGLAYPGVLNYGTHLEINACTQNSYEYLMKMYRYCKTRDLPMAVNVHYWHLRDRQGDYKGFFDFVKYAISDGAEPTLMRDVLNK